MTKTPVQPKVSENHEALAPYNFIPLPEKVITVSVTDLPDQGVFCTDRHTGYIDCELTTSSPVFIRAGLKPEQAKDSKKSKESPEFFYLDEKNDPIIPGSSLRGMLRTLVEIVTFSKIGSVTRNSLVYRSVGGTTNHDDHYRSQLMHLDREEKDGKNMKFYTPLIHGGYMIKKGPRDWVIQPAKEIDGTTYAHINIDEDFFRTLKRVKNCQNAYEIFIKAGPYQYQDVRGGFLKIKFAKVVNSNPVPKPGLHPAILACSGRMNSKKSEAVIYERDNKKSPLPLTDEQIDTYIDQVSKEQKNLLGDNGVLNDGQPVFYILDNKTGQVKFFGHTRMFRIPYPHSPLDYVPEYARPTDEPGDPNNVDYAEAIFGYTRKTGVGIQRAYAGRVSCTDASLIKGQDNNIWLSPKDPVMLKILSSPKPTTFQHYLVQIEPDLYPEEQTRGGEIKYVTRLRDYASLTPHETVIRGHKLYWHKGVVTIKDIQEESEIKADDKLHTLVYPLKEGVRFHFRVNFENLNDKELGALMWIFNVASDENIRLKIGMGKPLGMGAVSIKSSLYIQHPRRKYASLLVNGKWENGVEQSDSLSNKVVKTFVNSVLKELNEGVPDEEHIHELTKVRQIGALLTMLQWPGPDCKYTRYMEIKHPDPKERKEKKNEYSKRPVLPTPFGVWSKKKSR